MAFRTCDRERGHDRRDGARGLGRARRFPLVRRVEPGLRLDRARAEAGATLEIVRDEGRPHDADDRPCSWPSPVGNCVGSATCSCRGCSTVSTDSRSTTAGTDVCGSCSGSDPEGCPLPAFDDPGRHARDVRARERGARKQSGRRPEPYVTDAVESTRRRQLVEVALGILETEGLDGLTMRSLAAGVGMQAPSLYKHVADKDELTALLIFEAFRDMGRALRDAIGALPKRSTRGSSDGVLSRRIPRAGDRASPPVPACDRGRAAASCSRAVSRRGRRSRSSPSPATSTAPERRGLSHTAWRSSSSTADSPGGRPRRPWEEGVAASGS